MKNIANGILEEFEGEYVFTLERRIETESEFEDAERDFTEFGDKREGLTREPEVRQTMEVEDIELEDEDEEENRREILKEQIKNSEKNK